MVAQIDLAPHLERCFLFDAVEDSYEITETRGHVPEWLRGTYYVNGPARFERAGIRYRNWLDGDGMVCALHFGSDGIRFANRFVGTRKFREEQAAGIAIYRSFGTAFAGDRLRRNVMIEPAVNVSVYPFAGTLLAFGEQSLPVELDPVTLETRGEYDFHGRLNEVSPFAAHAKFDPFTGHMFNFGVSYSTTRPCVYTYEVDASGCLQSRRRHALEFSHAVHDFGVSSRHFAFFLSPLIMDAEKFLCDGASVFDSLRWRPETGSRILVVPREAGEQPFSIKTGTGYCLHMINCFEQSRRLAVDLIELEAPIYAEYQPVPNLYSSAPPGRPVRYWIDLGSRSLVERMAMRYDRTPDFPSIDSRLLSQPYDHVWMLGLSSAGQPGRKFFDQLALGSWREGDATDLFQSDEGEYLCGEPVFVRNPNTPDGGVVIVQNLKPREDLVEFLLFEALALGQGPIARIPLRHRVHPGFHASFKGE